MRPPATRGLVFALAAVVLVVGAVGAFVGRAALLETWSIYRLEHGDEGARLAAADALAQCGSLRSVEPLVAAYVATARAGFGPATQRVSRGRAPVATGMLVKLPGTRSEALRVACVDALVAIGVGALDRLAAALTREPSEIRLETAYLLLRCGAPATAAHVLRELFDDPAASGRLDIVKALGETGEHGVPSLEKVLRSRGGPLRREASAALANIGPPAVPALEGRLFDRSELLRVRMGALESLCQIARRSKRAQIAVERVLNDPHEALRGRAFETLEALGVAPGGPHAHLRVGSTEGVPGDTVSLLVEGDLDLVTHGIHVVFDTSTEMVVEYRGTALADTVVAEAPARAAVFFPDPRGGGTRVGVWLRGEGMTPLSSGPNQKLFRVRLRIRPGTAPGEYSLVARETFVIGDGGRKLEAKVTQQGSLRVLPLAPGGSAARPTAPAVEGATSVVTEDAAATAAPLPENYSVRAEVVRAAPGAKGVAVRVYGSTSRKTQGYSIGLRIDPAFVRLRRLTLESTAAETAKYDNFVYQKHVLDTGETAAGVLFDMTGAWGHRLPTGADQHLLTVLVDIDDKAPAGTVVPVQLGAYGDPPQRCVFTVNVPERGVLSRHATVTNGAIRIEAMDAE